MCELLGMSANVPTDICFSFTGLIRRGGETGPHKDGWGISFYEGKGYREFRDPEPSIDSEIARLIKNYPIKSKAVISHIRQANVGGICLENTHPFSREMWGRYWSYAHNGQLKDAKRRFPASFYLPVGTTDSEQAFCWLLAQLRLNFTDQCAIDPMGKALHGWCEQLREQGVFNMLLSNGDYLFVYCSTKLSWITRRAPFGKAHLSDVEVTVDFKEETTPDDVVTVIATQPLTDNEDWHTMQAGELIVFRDGEVVVRHLSEQEQTKTDQPG
ncbi:class II glutamine amidotransferase [Oceanospirillum sediminis]|uniref:Class II glutamine amidotransferase n=1 Tax=Oceanospirillum sediminis TaxID=2760088 RepID=A0A839IQT2_9GAMM|nr:class II glutamine amidotransferase [Oceanospirillum sediminis]MBB1487070.1 class II glutamine amidotransferase [Oceanospirillum sediminis]